MVAVLSRLNKIIGGDKERDANALMVTPCGACFASSVVTTVTPVAKHPRHSLNVASATVVICSAVF